MLHPLLDVSNFNAVLTVISRYSGIPSKAVIVLLLTL